MNGLDDARAHVRRELGSEELRKAMISAYADFYNSPYGRLVLDELILTYHDRQSRMTEEEAATIEHPYRAYFVEGQRSVVLALRATAEAAARGEL